MKKIVYFLGAVVIALNMLFTFSPEGGLIIQSSEAQVGEVGDWCAITEEIYPGYRQTLHYNCFDPQGKYCAFSSTCSAEMSSNCSYSICDFFL